jgi:hypothetical protein
MTMQFFKDINNKVIQKVQEAEKMLKRQIFSQQMLENLINDLLDLAKLDNNSF